MTPVRFSVLVASIFAAALAAPGEQTAPSWPSRHPTAPFVFPEPSALRVQPTPTPVPESEAPPPDPLDDVSLPKAAFLMPGRGADDILRPRLPLADDRGPAETRDAARIVVTNRFRDMAVRIVAVPSQGDPLVLLLPPGQSDAFDLPPGPWSFRRETWRAADGAAPPAVEEFPAQRLEPKRRYDIVLDDQVEKNLRRFVDAPVRE